MPEMTTSRLVRGRFRLWAKRSDTNEADEALSSKAHATMLAPLDGVTLTRQVMSKALCFMPTAVAEMMSCTGLEV